MNVERFKREAKKLKKSGRALTHSEALDRVAEEYGFKNWSLLMREVNRQKGAK